MKAPVKAKDKKDKVKKKGVVKPKPKKQQVLVVASEINYAKRLSGNDKTTRDRMLKSLKKWITHHVEKGYDFKEEDFARVWTGLFYAVWMSDKPLIQEELCDNIASLLDLFPPEHLKYGLLMTKAGFKKLATEWYGIDHHRMDKFLMLVRRYLRGSLRCLDRCGWSVTSCQKYAKMLSASDGLFAIQTPHYARNATSMILHFADCFLEELAKVSQGKIEGESVAALLKPFVQYTCSGTVLTVCTASRRVLTALLRQSEIGLEYEAKTRAWKRMGCPAGGPDALEPASDDDDEENTTEIGDGDHDSDDNGSDKPLDPRAGRVDVELPLLPVPARELAAMLGEMLVNASSKAHRRVKICLQRFQKLAEGEYPLPVEAPPVRDDSKLRPTRAARSLHQLEQKLRVEADELKLRGLSRKHKKRLLRKSRAGLSIVEDVEALKKTLSKESNNGEWLVEAAEDKNKEDTSDKENEEKVKKNKSPQKRKNNTDTQNATKKPKLEKNKSNLGNTSKKVNVVENSNKKMLSKKDKKANSNNDVVPKQKDVKLKTKNNKGQADVLKVNKPKNQPQIILEKAKSPQLNKSEVSKLEEKSKVKAVKTPETPKAKTENPKLLVNKTKKFQKQLTARDTRSKMQTPTKKQIFSSPKKVKFVLHKNSMQKPIDYYKSVRQSPNIPFDSSKKPTKTNLKPSTPSPINPFFKKKLRMK